MSTIKTIVFADIHHSIEDVRRVMADKKNKTARFIFTGDFYDSRDSKCPPALEVTKFVREIEADPRTVAILIGNHDAQYVWPECRTITCKNFDSRTQRAVPIFLFKSSPKVHFVYYDEVTDVLFSHAGVSNNLFYSVAAPDTKEEIIAHLTRTSKELKDLLNLFQEPNMLANISLKRGGYAPIGGCMWCDITEFAPIPGIAQIFGHSCVKHPVIIEPEKFVVGCSVSTTDLWAQKGFGLDIDLGQTHYLRIKGDSFLVKPFRKGSRYYFTRFNQ